MYGRKNKSTAHFLLCDIDARQCSPTTRELLPLTRARAYDRQKGHEPTGKKARTGAVGVVRLGR